MARPASRGGAMPTRGPVAANYPAPAGAFKAPPTASGQMMRQPTAGRPGSGFRDPNTPSVGLSTELNVSARPVTQQGLTGMQTQGATGPGRQIADKSFYLSTLRNKLTDITKEIANLKNEQETIRKDNEKYSVYERKYESLMTEVRSLEGQLADFNLALDKIRTNTNLNEIKDAHEKLKSRNDFERKGIDEVFVKVSKVQATTKGYDQQIQAIYDTANKRMEALGEDVQSEFSDLQDETSALGSMISEAQSRVQELDKAIGERQAKLNSREYQVHAKGVELQKQQKALMATKRELEEETSNNLSPDDMKNKLLEKMKQANADIQRAEETIKKHEEALDRLAEDRREKEALLMEAKKHAQKSKKYEEVYARDRKMQEFIDQFPENMKSEAHNLKKLQVTIVAHLVTISKALQVEKQLPDAEQLAQMRGELSFKEQKMQNSKNTLQVLGKDLEMRKDELEKINTLDKKINLELKSLKEKIKQMEQEMENFKPEDVLKEEAAEKKKRLLRESTKWKKQRESIKQQVSLYSAAYEKQKKELNNNETMKTLDALETKLKSYAGTSFQLSDFIATQKRESDYQAAKTRCLDLTDQINKIIIDQINATGGKSQSREL